MAKIVIKKKEDATESVNSGLIIPTVKLRKGEGLMLRTCTQEGLSSAVRLINGKAVEGTPFQWPKGGPVKCDDWSPKEVCGGGLHGLLWGMGDGSLLNWGDAAWLVVRIDMSDIVRIGTNKIKVPKGNVVYFGDRGTATALIQAHAPIGSAVIGGTATAGDRGTATAGDRGTATAGYSGTATAGDRGTATAGDRGTATAGDRGTATAGYRGTAIAGDCGTISIRYWNGEKYRTAVFEVGENGIEPNIAYRVDNQGKPYKATV